MENIFVWMSVSVKPWRFFSTISISVSHFPCTKLRQRKEREISQFQAIQIILLQLFEHRRCVKRPALNVANETSIFVLVL